MATRRESVVRGALVITVATLVARIMGAFYRPIVVRLFAPFDHQDGTAGLGMAQAPISAYAIVLAFTSVGFNVAISKLIAERLSIGDEAGARKVFRTSLWLMAGLGVLGTLVFFWGAPWLEAITKMPGTASGYRAMAPAILLISVMAAYRGLFQGFQSMTPNAYSQLIEAVLRIAAGLVLIYALVPHSVELGAAGFNLGDSIGGIAGLLYLLYLYNKSRETMWQEGMAAAATATGRTAPAAGRHPEPDTRATLKMLLRIAVPIALIGAAQPIMMWADAFTVGHFLPTQGLSAADAENLNNAVYGQLTNGLNLVLLPAVFAVALYTSLIPAIAEATALGRKEHARNLTVTSYRMTMLVGWPSMIGLAVLATPINHVIMNTLKGADILAVLALATLPIMVQTTSSGILQGMGRMAPPVTNLLLGTALKIVLTVLLVPLFGGLGAAWSTVAAFTLAAGLNLISVHRHMEASIDFVGGVVKPGLAAGIMGLGVWGLDTLLEPFAHGGLAKLLMLLVIIALGGALYGLALLLVRGVAREDLERVPRIGRKLASLLTRVRLLPEA